MPPFAFHPFAFGFFPAATLIANNLDQAGWDSIQGPLWISVFVFVALGLLVRFLESEPKLRPLVLSLSLAAFYSYGHLHDFFEAWLKSSLAKNPSLFAANGKFAFSLLFHFPLTLCLLCGILVLRKQLRKRTGLLEPLSGFCNVAGGVLLLGPVLTLIQGAGGAKAEAKLPVPGGSDLPKLESYAGEKPDVYFFILDGFARRDILKADYQADTPEFYQGLEKLGFKVLPKARSNYAWTFLSLASTLNFQHHLELAKTMPKGSRDRSVPYQMIRDSRVSRFLKGLGYRYVSVASTWGPTLRNTAADLELRSEESFTSDELTRVFLRSSAFKTLDFFLVGDLASFHLGAFENFAKIPELEGPKFTFGHMLLPHHPFLFEADGTVRSNQTLMDQFKPGGWADKEGYVGQVKFTARKILEAIEKIVARSKVPPVIFLQSDHGPQVYNVPRPHFVHSRHAILHAVLAPKEVQDAYTEDSTSIQTFPIFFRKFFGAKVEDPPTDSYTSGYTRPYEFQPYEEALKESEEGSP